MWEMAEYFEDMALEELAWEDLKSVLVPEVEFDDYGYTSSRGRLNYHEMSEAHMANAIKYFGKYEDDRMNTLVGYLTKALEERKCIEAFAKGWR